MKRQSLILVLLALLPALSAAQTNRFRAIDRNHDGFITSEEWYAQSGVAPVPFTMVDVNGDGRISEAEFREWSAARGGAGVLGITAADRFRAIDKNKDGVISAQEWKNGMLSLVPFSDVDTHKRGTISRSEFIAWDEKHGGAAGAAPLPPPGIAASSIGDRLRSLDHGVSGPAGPAGIAGPTGVQPTTPPAPSSLSPSPHSPITTVPQTSQIPGASSPNMSSGSSLSPPR